MLSKIIIFKNKHLESTINQLTTRNSRLSTIWLPSASNMLKAILKPAWGSKELMQKECIISCSTNAIKQYNVQMHLLIKHCKLCSQSGKPLLNIKPLGG